MNAKKCDRCKKLYEEYMGQAKDANDIQLWVHSDECYSALGVEQALFIWGSRRIDLCPDCMESFKNWLKEGERA